MKREKPTYRVVVEGSKGSRRRLSLPAKTVIRAFIKGGVSFAAGVVFPPLGFALCVASELLDPILDKIGLDEEP